MDSLVVDMALDNDWTELEWLKEIFSSTLTNLAELAGILDTTMSQISTSDNAKVWFSRGKTALLIFVRNNFLGPPFDVPYFVEKSLEKAALTDLLGPESGGKHPASCQKAELLWLANHILVTNQRSWDSLIGWTGHWWALRCCMIVERISGGDRSESRRLQMFDSIAQCGPALASVDCSVTAPEICKLGAQFYLEAARAHNYYFYVEPAGKHLQKAMELDNLDLQLTGKLGRRTRFQQRSVAQLLVETGTRDSAKSPEIAAESPPTSQMPVNCALQDEVLLSRVNMDENESAVAPLSALHQALILGTMELASRTHAQDKLLQEEALAYVESVLQDPRDWAVQTSALVKRSALECKQRRKVERALAQVQALVDQHSAETPDFGSRFSNLVFCVDLPPIWELEKLLAELLVALGCTRDALPIYERLELWPELIGCFRTLGKAAQAEAVIRNQLANAETPYLYCCLGEVTGLPEHFAKAWKLSGAKYGPAQRALGMYHLNKRHYAEAAQALELSVKAQPYDASAWFNLGFCALELENFDLAIRAFHRHVNIEPENHEGWNNLGAAYTRAGQKPKALLILQEALKWDFDNVKIWQNFLLLALDTGSTREALQAVTRLMDLKSSWLDEECLDVLWRLISTVPPEDGPLRNPKDQFATLMGRITSRFPTSYRAWAVFAQVVQPAPNCTSADAWDTYLRRCLKALSCLAQKPRWEKDIGLVSLAAKLGLELLRDLQKALSVCEPESSASIEALKVNVKFTVKSVLAKLKVAVGELSELKDTETAGRTQSIADIMQEGF